MLVSEQGQVADADTMKLGLLMEGAQIHQKLAQTHLEKLLAHTQDLDGVVRDEIRRTLIDELQALTAETDRAVRALRDMKRAAMMRCFVWNVGAAILCTVIPVAIAHYAIPSPSQIAALRAERNSLAQSVALLERRGARVDWRNCGDAARLCVRVDRKSPAYGDSADFYVVKGY